MKFKHLHFNNFKTFYGNQKIDLYIPDNSINQDGKNIILIGGLNGAGKTTILKAIHFALFGKREMTTEDYNRIFSNVINNQYFDEGGREASVSLAIEMDNKATFEIKVIWQFDKYKKLISESRTIKYYEADSHYPKKQIVEDQKAYERMIDKIIPIHAAPFFIFDGEELKDIIIRQKSSGLKNAIDRITGITLYNKYISDLKAIQSNLQRELSKTTNIREIDRDQKKADELTEEINTLKNEINKFNDKKTLLTTKREEIRNKIDRKITYNQTSRDKLISKRQEIEAKIQAIETNYNEHYIPSLPYLILSDKIKILQTRLKDETHHNEYLIKKEAAIKPYHQFMNELFQNDIFPPLTDVQKQAIKELGEQIWLKDSQYQKNQNLLNGNVRHHISNRDINMINSIQYKNFDKIKNDIIHLKDLQSQKEQINEKIENAPGPQDISEEQAEGERLAQLARDLDRKLKRLELQLDKYESEKQRLSRKISDAISKRSTASELTEQYNIITNVLAASEEYIEKIRHYKTKKISEEFANMLKILFRKKDEFGDVFFDINDYQIKIHSTTGQELSILDRSAGEMQMISSSFIWAITRASNYNLPMVIDTPLGRLDSYHRNELINHYYKNLSDQVIILSTDTEITKEYIDFMKEHSYSQYLLDYNEDKKYTQIKSDYFSFV